MPAAIYKRNTKLSGRCCHSTIFFRWIVYDLPAIIRVRRRLAERDGLTGLRFVDRIEDAGGYRFFSVPA